MADIQYTLVVKDDGTPVLKKFGDGIDKTDSKMGALRKSFSGATGALKAMGAVMAGGAVVGFVKDTLEALDAQKKFASTIGITTKSAVGFSYAAELAGSSTEEMQVAMTKLAKNMASGSANKSLAKLGISARDASGNLKGADEVMYELSDRFAGMQDGADKTAFAMDLMGKSGSKLIPTLNDGSAALKSLVDEGASLSGANEDTVASMERFNDAMTKIEATGRGLVTSIVSSFGPEIEAFGKTVDRVVKNISENLERARVEETTEANYELARQMTRVASLKADLIKQEQSYAKYTKEGNKQAAWYQKQGIDGTKKEIELIQGKIDARRAEGAAAAKKAEDAKNAARNDPSFKEPTAGKGKVETRAELAARKEKELQEIFERRYKREQVVLEYKQKQEQDAFTQFEARQKEIADNEKKYSQQNEEANNSEWQQEQYILSWRMEEEERVHQAELQRIEDEKEARMQAMQSVAGIASNLNSAIERYNQSQTDAVSRKYSKQRKAVEETAALEIEKAKGNSERIRDINTQLEADRAAIDKKSEAETLAVKKKTFAIQQGLSIVEATMNGAVAVTQALAAAPPPFNYALAASVGIATAAEIALIKSQKLASGGSAIGRNAIVMMNEKGEERVLNAEATKTAGSQFVNTLNSGASMSEALAVSGMRGGKDSFTINLTVAGFIDSPKTANYIVGMVEKAVRARR